MNIVGYVKENKNTFDEQPFSNVDSLVLSQLSYLHFDNYVPSFEEFNEGVILRDLFCNEFFDNLFKDVRDPANNKILFTALASSRRFRNIKVNYYVNELNYETEKQFSAVTFIINDELAYVAFRGTDSTLIGWKEDFNMTFMNVVPAQRHGEEYLRSVSKYFHGDLLVGGHSKGGNIAVFSALACAKELDERIVAVYNHDGPGFVNGIVSTEAFETLSNRVHKTIPQSSLFGMLLEDKLEYTVIKSNRFGIMQHDPFSWVIEGDKFIVESKVSSTSNYVDKTIHDWLYSVDEEKRKMFVDTFYMVIKASGAKTLSEFQQLNYKQFSTMLKHYSNVDSETRMFINKTIRRLIILSLRNTSKKRKVNNQISRSRLAK